MGNDTRERFGGPAWETLEVWVREEMRGLIQAALEEEITELLGRVKSERRAAVDAPPGYRNGYGKPQRLATSSGTIEVRRPRVRGLEERFESRVLPLSKSSVRRLRARWTAEHEAWSRRPLGDRELVYAWADGIYVKAGLERDKAALLVVIGAMSDGTKEVLAVTPGYRESVESWAAVLRDLKARGLGTPKLLVADGNLGIWGAAREVWPETAEQRCWNHKTTGVLDRLPKREQAAAREMLRAAAYAPSPAAAKEARDAFRDRYGDAEAKAVAVLEDDWDRMTAFYDYPEKHWRHLRTTNVVESPFASVRLRTTAAKRFQAGRQRHGADLAAAAGGREEVQEAQRAPLAGGGVRREEVRGRKARPRGSGEDRRLMTFTHPLIRPQGIIQACQVTDCQKHSKRRER